MLILWPDKLHGQLGHKLLVLEEFWDFSFLLPMTLLLRRLLCICLNIWKVRVSNCIPNPPKEKSPPLLLILKESL